MPYLKIEFIPQFYMEPLLKKTTHKYEEHVLRDVITLDLKRLWKSCKVTAHLTLSRRTYWMIKGPTQKLLVPWINCPIKLFVRGTITTIEQSHKPAMPLFKLEINKLIVLTIVKGMNNKTVDGKVWDLTDGKVRKIIYGGSIMDLLHVEDKSPRYKKSNFSL